jgi:hypothetical protein
MSRTCLVSVEARSDEQRVVCAFLVTDDDFRLADGHFGGRIHKVAEEMSRPGLFVRAADSAGQQTVYFKRLKAILATDAAFINCLW